MVDLRTDLAVAVLGVYCVDEEGGAVVPHKVKDPCRRPQQPVSLQSIPRRWSVSMNYLRAGLRNVLLLLEMPASSSMSKLHKGLHPHRRGSHPGALKGLLCKANADHVRSERTHAVAQLMNTQPCAKQ